MKILKYGILVLFALSAAAIGFTSCLHGGKVTSIAITPAHGIITAGTSQQFTANAKFSDGITLNWSSAVTWSTDSPDVTISNTLGSNGLATSLVTNGTGTFTITAIDTINHLSATATLTVVSTPLVSIAVTPIDQSVVPGATLQFTATGTYADGSTQDLTSAITWSSTNTAVATISNTPDSNGLVTAVAAGTTTITATDPATQISESTTLVVE